MVLDWHNYGYTIMEANKVSPTLCLMGKFYEQLLGRFADRHLTVSKAFKEDLVARFGIERTRVSVLYDRAVRGKFGPVTFE